MAIIQNLEAFVQSYPAGLDSVTDLQLSQNENGRQIRFTIGGVTIPAGSVATISGTKPDGVVYSNTGTIEGADTVIFDEDVQMTAVFGTWYAKIRITNAGNTIASARVRFIIDKDPVDAGAIPSESQLDGLVAEAEEYAGAAEDAAERAAITYGSPLTAATASAMTDINRVYVYTGSESGYTYGNWYYYNGSAWVSGGIYNSAAVETDTTLTVSGVPADAKATGDKIDELKDDLEQFIEDFGGSVDDAVNYWLDEHPEATTTVVDGAITTPKLSTDLQDTIVPLSKFSGATDAEKLYNALITDQFKGTILCGNISIESVISLPNAQLRQVKIANAIITLNSDMFSQTGSYARLPSFINCKFIGNGNAIYGGSYAVCGNFINCVFDDCSLVNDNTATIQNLYLSHCEVVNDTVPFIKAYAVYDCRVSNVLCEAQSQTFIDTFDSGLAQGGTQNLWVCDSSFESYTSVVFKLSGGNVYIKNCYFENNSAGVLYLKKNADGYDILILEICGCKINQSVTPFAVEDFTDNYRVKISIHDNYYYTSVAGTPMCTGIPVDNIFVNYNNRTSATTDVINNNAQYIYDPTTPNRPTLHSDYLSFYAGGWIQFGRLVFIDMVVKAKTTTGSDISSAITSLPNSAISNVVIPIANGLDGSATTKELVIAGTTARFNGGMTADERYLIKGFYFTDNKVIK